MTRSPRACSETGFYHVTQRGNAHTYIFESDHDRRQFLRTLKRCRDDMGFRVIAWCLMDDHYHLVLDAYGVELARVMHRINTTYAMYFNQREGRDGHLFQGPFRSVPITSDEQLVATVDYVHRNPEKAGLCPMSEYRWSSVREYLGTGYVVDTGPVLGILGGVDSLLGYEGNPGMVARTRRRGTRLSDEAARRRAIDVLGDESLKALRSTDRGTRNQAIIALAQCGIQLGQIARLSGLGERTISRIVSKDAGGASARDGGFSVRRVRVIPYDPTWPQVFAKEAASIMAVLGDLCVDIHHIGSTAVEGLAAKPTVDLMPVVTDIAAVDERIRSFEQRGYVWLGEHGVSGRRYLYRRVGANDVSHLHVFEQEREDEIQRHLAVRDYLRSHNMVANTYADIKLRLAAEYPYDADAYSVGKHAFVSAMEQDALKWAQSRSTNGGKGPGPNPPRPMA